MGSRTRNKAGSSQGPPTRGRAQLRSAEKCKDNNVARRQKYRADPDYREKQKARAREYYQRSVSTKEYESSLNGGVLRDGTEREVTDNYAVLVVESYTLRETAHALGRTLLTLRRWLKDQMIPNPVVVDTTYGHSQYIRGEVDVMAQVLAQHERQFKYFRKQHIAPQEAIYAGISGYRKDKGVSDGYSQT